MNWIVVLFFSIFVICVLLIIITLTSLPKLGDERKNFIKMKAQSYAFTIVIGLLLIEIIEIVYLTFLTDGSYEGMNPITFLVAISVVYLLALLFSKKKYGG
ncbi:hypothetical protein ACIQZG_08945 [Lysinibacillus sp. NPDC096418]|uniref:hypothetical protein n=1 Tax=Lysinibacillus sp. NPDC096418 TaxID=3364138 RepID=UPI0037F6FB38